MEKSWGGIFVLKNQLFVMKKYIILILFCLLSTVSYAQFYSSETVYCYQYDYTNDDGIKSKKSSNTIYFVNFQNAMMGITSDSIEGVRKKMIEDKEYYNNCAIEDLASSYREWKKSPVGLVSRGLYRSTVSIKKYCSELSTSSKYTYRGLVKYACAADYYPWQNYWSNPSWDSRCWSFSSDRKEMIIWSIDDPDNRDYYKLIDASSLELNLDFLY